MPFAVALFFSPLFLPLTGWLWLSPMKAMGWLSEYLCSPGSMPTPLAGLLSAALPVLLLGWLLIRRGRWGSWFLPGDQWLRNNPTPMLLLDPQRMTIRYANAAAIAEYGYPPAQLKGVSIHRLHPKGKTNLSLQTLRTHYQQARIRETHQRQNGSLVEVLVHTQNSHCFGSRVKLLQITVVDDLIEKGRRISQTNLELSDFRFAIQRATMMGVIDQDGTIKDANDNLCQLYQRSRHALLGQKVDFSFSKTEAPLLAQIQASLEAQRIWRGEIKHQRNTQSQGEFWTQSYFIPFRGKSEAHYQAIFIYTDITERKRSEEAALRREEYLRSIVDSQGTFMIRVDLQQRYTFVNQAFERAFGFLLAEGESFIGKSYLTSVHPDDEAETFQIAQRTVMQPGQMLDINIRKPAPGGGYIWTEWEFVSIQDETGQVIEIQAIGRDITRRMLSQAREQQQTQQLKDIAWLASHDLRRPVANLLGLLYLLRENPESELTQILSLLIDSAKDLDGIVHRIVDKAYRADQNQAAASPKLAPPREGDPGLDDALPR